MRQAIKTNCFIYAVALRMWRCCIRFLPARVAEAVPLAAFPSSMASSHVGAVMGASCFRNSAQGARRRFLNTICVSGDRIPGPNQKPDGSGDRTVCSLGFQASTRTGPSARIPASTFSTQGRRRSSAEVVSRAACR